MVSPPPTPFLPTAKERRAALEDVAYEMEQLIGTTQYLASKGPRLDKSATEEPAEILDANVYLEAFLLHVRVLLDFLEHAQRGVRNKQELDDVLATDYGFPARPINIDAALRTRLNQDLAHLSYSRTKRLGEAKDWHLDVMARPVLERFDEFAAHILAQDDSAHPEGGRERFEVIRTMIGNLLAGSEA